MKQFISSRPCLAGLKNGLFCLTLFVLGLPLTSFVSPEVFPPILMTLEDFEDESAGAKSFSVASIDFESSGDLEIENAPGFGAGPSAFYLGTVAVNGGSSGSIGSIQITTASTSFTVTSFAAWTSNNDGLSRATGDVTFTGTLAAGGTASETITIAPTTDDGNGYVTVSFTGALAGAELTELEVILPANLNYIAIDDFNFSTAAIATNQYSINDVAILEGNGSSTIEFVFTISRTSNAAAGSVDVEIEDGSATAGDDYTDVALTTINFTAGGPLTQTHTVIVNGDDDDEPNENFLVILSNPVGGTILDDQGVGTILDEDGILETYEDETDGSTSFTENSISFTTLGDLEVEFSTGFGSSGSDYWLGTVSGDGGTSGSAGSIQIATASTSFNVVSLDAWTSNNDGLSSTSGMVTFTGTLVGGGTVSHSAMVTPVGDNYDVVSFVGTPLENAELTSLEITLSGGLNYIAIDNFGFATEPISAPEMDVTGNGNPVDDGSTSPTTGNGTNFGTVCTGNTVTQTFTIENNGSSDLVLDGAPLVSLTGSADFTITIQPASPVSAGGSTTFTVQFLPSSAGLISATVSIENNDSDEDPYDFSIQGTGVEVVADAGGPYGPVCTDGSPITVTGSPTPALGETGVWSGAGIMDNADGTASFDPAAAGAGSHTLTYTFTDANGCTSAATTIVDVYNPPLLTAGAIDDCYATAAEAEAAAIAATSATADCPGTLGYAASTMGSCSATVTVTVTDACGCDNSVVYSTRIDNTPPTAICQEEVTVQLDATGTAGISAAQVDDGSFDNCGPLQSLSVFPNSFTCANLGDNTVTLTATDECGNANSCLATVNVEDNVDPATVCQNATVQLDASGNATITAADVNNGSNDACGIQSYNVSPDNFDCSDIGENAVTLTVTDVNGNTATCTATVTVVDNLDPAAVCKNINVQLSGSGATTITAQDVNNGSSDNCAEITLSISGQTSFDCGDVGQSFPVVLTVTDGSGNTSTCSANVTVSGSNLSDTDCDGVGDACDVCPGGEDSVDNNNDGIPDCSQLLSYNQYSPAWYCGNNKIKVCHNVSHNPHTNCINKNALPAHFNHGDYVGPCTSCGNQNLTAPGSPVTTIANEIQLFPNPAWEEVTVLISKDYQKGSLTMLDLTGKSVLNVPLEQGTTHAQLHVSHLVPGLYLVLVQLDGEKMMAQKLIIER